MKEIITKIINDLNKRLETENQERRKSGALLIAPSKITILGQTSLLIQPEFTYMLNLAQTGDFDAQLRSSHEVKKNLKEILPQYGMTYDEDSDYVFIPKGSQFSDFLKTSLIHVEVIDPESALVSKAVKAPEKNLQLIRQAIASESYPNLVPRIVDNGGLLENFV